ncbi:hypothetical protein [Halocatena pleomorpha]|uniref:Uncharacterized protein n=1 Tax=Halocatena pleomorpha TaxID=1785090 RepID=A0A3P3RHC0_9EURY|nr:hypothetical protein [Halocatena pleomorpha]RRJ32160.1 hypothetical protein EIK79_05170 [Halocatena pleomorpha]
MFSFLFVTLTLDSLFLGTGLFTLCIGFALESVRTRNSRAGVLSIVCAVGFVSIMGGFVSSITVATYILLAAQVGGMVFFALFFRHWLRSLSRPLPERDRRF